MKIGDIFRYKYDCPLNDNTTEERDTHGILIGFGRGSILVKQIEYCGISITIDEIDNDKITGYYSNTDFSIPFVHDKFK